MKKSIFFLAFCAWLCNFQAFAWEKQLGGSWKVSLDSLASFCDITLPSTTDMAGIGTPTTLSPALEKPQLLRLTRRNSFIGKAFYSRDIDIPKEAANRPLLIELERIIWGSCLYIDGVEAGDTQESLVTPHRFVLKKGLKAGKHSLMVAVDNRQLYNINSQGLAHAYTDDTQTRWNGILGKMFIKTLPKVEISNVKFTARNDNNSPSVSMELVRHGSKQKSATVTSCFAGVTSNTKFVLKGDTTRVEMVLNRTAEINSWDEFHPNLYDLKLSCGEDVKSMKVGLRTIKARGKQILVNDNPIFLRGTLECCIFPLTGVPPTDKDGWLKVFNTAREHGLNHLRFHSYCPPEAAFSVADSLGFYIQVELPNWSINLGEPGTETLKDFLRAEGKRIVDEYGNHPSFCFLSMGNELQHDFVFLNELTASLKQYDHRRLYTTSTFSFENGHGKHPEPQDDYFVTQYTDRGWIRGQGVFNSEFPSFNRDYRQSLENIDIPVVSHEIGQYSVYPNLSEIDKYTGILKPLNFMAVRNDLQRKGMLNRAHDYLMASGKLAALLYKEEIERAMKTPGLNGFQLLGLQDFPGQGTALVGLVDAFWDSKQIISPSEFRAFCSPVVPLAKFEKAVWDNSETFMCTFLLSNFYKEEISGRKLNWRIVNRDGNIYNSGSMNLTNVPVGTVSVVGDIHVKLDNISVPSKMKLEVSIADTDWHNSWSIWVYPAYKHQAVSSNITVTYDKEVAIKAAEAGKKVLLVLNPDSVKGLAGRFVPVFWSPVHFPHESGTMGLLCNPGHPALSQFPNDGHTDWQWWRLVKDSKAMIIDSIPEAHPIIEAIDAFTSNRKLAYMFEARCCKGAIVVSAMDILNGIETIPEKNQLLRSVLQYIDSDGFKPSGIVTPDAIRSLSL